MSWAAPRSQHQEIPAALRAALHRHPSPEKLYWRLQRPRAGVYARRARRVLLYRAAAAAAAIVAIALCAFLGMVLGNIGAPRWPALASIGARTFSLAVAHAVTEFSAWMPVFIVLGLILAVIPRPRRWVFRLAMLGAGALGYCERHLPPPPRPAASSTIVERTAALAARLPLQPPASSAGVAALVVVAAYVFYRYAYRFAARSTGLFPRRPVSHYRSTFAGLTMAQRLVAVPVAAALFLAVAWVAESIRAQLPGVQYGAFLFGYSHPSYLAWSLAALIVAWAVCMPRPNGSQWLFIVLLLGLTAYPFSPHVFLIRLPVATPVAGLSFWALVFTYLGVTGFGYSLVAALLDWR